MTKEQQTQKGRRLATVNKVASMPEYRDAFTVAALRHLIFQSTPRQDSRGRPLPTNGLVDAGAIIRLGKKVLIDLDAFDAWLDQHRVT